MHGVLYCPHCKGVLERMSDNYSCHNCVRSYPIIDGIPSFVAQNTTIDSFDASAFEFLFKMEQKHFWHVGRREIILDVLRENIPDLARCRMLEIGCGNGSVLAYLRQNGIDIEGGDIFREGLKFCQQRAGSASLYQIDILAMPFINSFDIVGLFDILEHIDEDEQALREINRALKPRGKVLLTVPAYKFLWSHSDVQSHHKRRYTKRDLVSKLERNGFVIDKLSFYMCFQFPLFAIVRLISNMLPGSRKRHNSTTSLELKTIPIINDILLLLLTLEKWLLRRLNLAFGSSLIALARKTDDE